MTCHSSRHRIHPRPPPLPEPSYPPPARNCSRGPRSVFAPFLHLSFHATCATTASRITLSTSFLTLSSGSSRSRLGPLPWTDFFAQEFYLDRDIGPLHITHHAYLTPPTSSGPLFVTHHGAGSSGLSFALFTAEIRKILPKAGVLSLDARGHGSTKIQNPTSSSHEPAPNLNLDTLSDDLAFVVNQVQQQMGWPTLPDMVLIGHSLGGAVVTDVAHKRLLGPSLLGYGVLDVVEGTSSVPPSTHRCHPNDFFQPSR